MKRALALPPGVQSSLLKPCAMHVFDGGLPRLPGLRGSGASLTMVAACIQQECGLQVFSLEDLPLNRGAASETSAETEASIQT